LSKRAPITFDQENEARVLEGIRNGTYDFHEVVAWTNSIGSLFPAARGNIHDSNDDEEEDDEEDFTRPMDDASLRARDLSEDGRGLDPEMMGDDYEEGDDELLGEVMDEDLDENDQEDHDNDGDEQIDDERPQVDAFDPTALGLREINNLAHFGVSSHKPGNGVEELLSDDLDKFWQ
jgi:anaphase-promoting complex subunit 10